MEQLREQVVCMLADYIGIEKSSIRSDSALAADLGLSSLDVVNVVVAFEEAFDIEIPDEDIIKMVTVEDIIFYLDHKRGTKRTC